MSHDERIATVNLLNELIGDPLGAQFSKFVAWLKWLVVAVVLGTTAVVGFVYETRSSTKDLRADHERLSERVNKLDENHGGQLSNMAVRHRDLERTVDRHGVMIERLAN